MKFAALIITFVAGTVVVTLVGACSAQECRLVRLWQAQEKWAKMMDRR